MHRDLGHIDGAQVGPALPSDQRERAVPRQAQPGRRWPYPLTCAVGRRTVGRIGRPMLTPGVSVPVSPILALPLPRLFLSGYSRLVRIWQVMV